MISDVWTKHDIKTVSQLANTIWTEHFTPIIGSPQVKYMLKTFQSPKAISCQIQNKGVRYYLLKDTKETPSGYLALKLNHPPKKTMISKIYIIKEARKKGFGKKLLKHAIEKARAALTNYLWLTVNRFNTTAISWYQKNGFKITDKQKSDIGRGFYMDDFIMQLDIRKFDI